MELRPARQPDNRFRHYPSDRQKRAINSRASGSRDDVHPTPVLSVGGDLSFDENYFWYFTELDVRAESLEGGATSFAVDFALRLVPRQQSFYRADVWELYAPALEWDHLLSLEPYYASSKDDLRQSIDASAPTASSAAVGRLALSPADHAVGLRGRRYWPQHSGDRGPRK